ncbi:hypothetical protein SCLCIDRAFT_1221162 [Scleroderma citrinum Foug A]|uniref:Uncharacterized protein n=1 Tax=Scleroderma citrinum Foug A TaxID=1036808 RepID=A0A0C3DGW4_9AGAM|nr:hypothetical protein SCLCIDRAFT_1221162 [Scleroderma citrinum Foug A]
MKDNYSVSSSLVPSCNEYIHHLLRMDEAQSPAHQIRNKIMKRCTPSLLVFPAYER